MQSMKKIYKHICHFFYSLLFLLTTKKNYKNNTNLQFKKQSYFFLKSISCFNHGLNFSKYFDYYFLNNINTKVLKKYYMNDFFIKHKVPSNLDYLSIDTEGSEYVILEKFNFNKYRPKIITVEHNFIKSNMIYLKTLLSKNGYRSEYEELSGNDYWFYDTKFFK